ncbi:MAG TPA: DNA polymerase III subunit beta [Clostridiales bacterium]|nr:DNA polymerase III subunit beta [Clostridiales bacterium]
MKVICDGLELSDAVLKVSKALAVKSVNPVLEGIKIIAAGDSLTLIATDTELTIEKKIKADVLMEGETVVVGKYFVDFAKKLEREQVELSRLYDSQLLIKYSDSESELQVFPAENFPEFNKTEEDYFVLQQSEFKKVVERTIIACSTDDSRPILKGCLFDINDNLLTAVALDGFRMAVVKKDVKASNNLKAVIPAKTLMEITRLLSGDDEELKVHVQKNSLYVEFDNTIIYSRLIEGEFVKYNHILPATFENAVTVNRQAFLNSIERASIVARNDRYNVIKFDIKENVMTVFAKSEVGNVNENVNVNLTGKDMTIAFNGKYLTDYLKIIDEEFITLNMNTPIDPCVITPVGNEGFLYLVLPVRINA